MDMAASGWGVKESPARRRKEALMDLTASGSWHSAAAAAGAGADFSGGGDEDDGGLAGAGADVSGNDFSVADFSGDNDDGGLAAIVSQKRPEARRTKAVAGDIFFSRSAEHTRRRN